MKVPSSLAEMVRGRFMAGVGSRHVIDRDGISCIGRKAFKWYRRDYTSGRGDASGVHIMGHVD